MKKNLEKIEDKYRKIKKIFAVPAGVSVLLMIIFLLLGYDYWVIAWGFSLVFGAVFLHAANMELKVSFQQKVLKKVGEEEMKRGARLALIMSGVVIFAALGVIFCFWYNG